MKFSVKSASDRPGEAAAQFRVGLVSQPWLADHGFQDMAVLPGSFYVDAALCVERELAGRVPAAIRAVRFQNPVILSVKESVIEATVHEHAAGRVEYRFHEAGDDGAPSQPVASLEVDRNPASLLRPVSGAQAGEAEPLDTAAFYAALRKNGNQYGPAFQRVVSLHRAGERCLAELSTARDEGASKAHCLHPSVLDAATQLLAPFMMGEGRTFILRGIERIVFAGLDLPATLRGEAWPLPAGADGSYRGNVRLFDGAGRTWLELSGVAFALLDRVEDAEQAPDFGIVAAANFTAEPID